MDDRDELKSVLQGLLDDVVDEPADAYILKRAISALRRLDDGEVDALFAPAKKASWGRYPARVRQIQAWATFWVSRLVDMGETATEAENQIADAMVVSPEVIHKWRTNLNKSPTSYLTEIIAHAAKNEKLLENLNIFTSPNKAEILSAAKNLGQEFKKAREKKFVLKVQKKKSTPKP